MRAAERPIGVFDSGIGGLTVMQRGPTAVPTSMSWRTPAVVLICGCLISTVTYGPRQSFGFSEGRRRAVALNNMLFSASIFTSSSGGGPTRHELLLVDPTEGQDLLFEVMSTPVKIRAGEIQPQRREAQMGAPPVDTP